MEKYRIIFVHGIGDKPNATKHLEEWKRSLGEIPGNVEYAMAYWADLREGQLSIPTKKEARSLVNNALTPIQREELSATTSYRTRFLPPHRRILNFFKDIVLSASEPLVKYLLDEYLDDVYNYFYRKGKRSIIRQRVTEIVHSAILREEKVIIVSHSMGTVIALDAIYQQKEAPVALFVTMGSPLGSSYIQRAIGKNHFPMNVSYWLNLYDRVDIVAMPDSRIENDFLSQLQDGEAVQDNQVRDNFSPLNERDPHHWNGYLSSAEIRYAIQQVTADKKPW